MPEPLTTLGHCPTCGAVDLIAAFPMCHGSRATTDHEMVATERVPVFSAGDMQAAQNEIERLKAELQEANEAGEMEFDAVSAAASRADVLTEERDAAQAREVELAGALRTVADKDALARRNGNHYSGDALYGEASRSPLKRWPRRGRGRCGCVRLE